MHSIIFKLLKNVLFLFIFFKSYFLRLRLRRNIVLKNIITKHVN